MSKLPSLRALLDAHGLFAKKSFGQHFLLDSGLLSQIASYAGELNGYHIIEIGPGPGGLTRALLSGGAHVTAIEKDERFAPLLQLLKESYVGQFDFQLADAMKVDVSKLSDKPIKIIANLPYNVGTNLLLGWLAQIAEHEQSQIQRLTLMFQKEVAERVVAEPNSKSYGRLSIISQYLCDVEWHQDVSAEDFTPPPKVDSAVISLTPKPYKLRELALEPLEKVVATAFNQRRKMLRAALKPLGGEELLAKAGIDGTRRAEDLSVEEFCVLAKHSLAR